MTPKNIICLWYDGTALEAARFYAETFPDSSVGAIQRAPGDFPMRQARRRAGRGIHRAGHPLHGPQWRPAFKHNEAFSFQVATADQAETDRFWNAIVGQRRSGERLRLVQGQVGRVVADHAARSHRGMADPDRAAAKRVFDAMMDMRKIDIATIEKARRG